ncbi:MAG: hypothetical protein U0136_18080 [Bdellovibrionota bacterium]
MSNFAPILFLPIAAVFLLGFGVLWTAIVSLVAKLSGWSELGKRFAGERPQLAAKTFRFASGSINRGDGTSVFSANYRTCLDVSLSADAIGLEVMFPFRFKHPPVVIPWGAFRAIRDDSSRFVKRTTFVVADPRITISLIGRVGVEVGEYCRERGLFREA